MTGLSEDRSSPLGTAGGSPHLRHFLLQPAAVILFEGDELLIQGTQIPVLRRFSQATIETNGILLGGQRDFEGALAGRAAHFQLADREDLPVFQARNLDEISDVLLGHGTWAGAVALEISLLQSGAVAPLLIRHLPEGGGDL